MDNTSIGQYLYEETMKSDTKEVAFVWNRTEDKMKGVVEDALILHDLADCASRYVGGFQMCLKSVSKMLYLEFST